MNIQSLDKHTEKKYCKIFSFHAMNAGNELNKIHRHSFYQLLVLRRGTMKHFVDFEFQEVSAPFISIVFPNQAHCMTLSDDAELDVVMFNESLFCSALLQDELKEYNIDIKKRLNYIKEVNEGNWRDVTTILDYIKKMYGKKSTIMDEQIKHLISIIILKVIEIAPQPYCVDKVDKNASVYNRFVEMLNTDFEGQKKVKDYSRELGISTKKMNLICNKYAGRTPLDLIHERLGIELKKYVLEDHMMLKDIAEKLGFSSQSALNKFIEREYGFTPNKWREYLQKELMGKMK